MKGGGGVRTLWSDVVQIKTKKVPIPGSGMPVMPADFMRTLNAVVEYVVWYRHVMYTQCPQKTNKAKYFLA